VISAETRTCQTCARVLPEEPPHICPNEACHRVAVPLVSTWSVDVKRWLVGRFVARYFAPWKAATVQYRWERLLVSVVAGETWGGRMIGRVADPAECYAVAVKESEAWASAERPALFE
jgi:hypothetical protein